MSKKNFRESLSKLKNEIDTVTPKTVKTQELLLNLDKSVLNILEHPGDAEFISHYDLMNNLKDSVAHFESDHPDFTATVRNVIHTLSNMGI